MKPVRFEVPFFKLLFQFVLGGIVCVPISGCTVFGVSTVEQSKYKVLKKEGAFEVRVYEPRILATTIVNGEYKKAQSKGFRRLAGYIFGDNKAKEKVPMTSPVSRTAEVNKSEKVAMTAPVQVTEEKPGKASEKVAMTSPVQQIRTESGWKVTFMMPSQYKKIADLPVPNSKKVVFEEIPEITVASVQFSWRTDEERNQKYAKKLRKWLQEMGEYKPSAGPTYAGYNPPWTLPMFRRQEVHYVVLPIKEAREDQEAQSVTD